MVLGGEYRHVVDAKNRLFIPAKLRDELGSTFIITKALRNRCLTVYSLEEWEAYIEPIRRQERKLVEETIRFLHAPLITVTPDSQGRVVLTPTLMRYAGLDKNAVIVGCSSYAEIWAAENYVSVDDEDDEAARLAMVEKLEKLGL
jgi:MraZ protein